MADDARAAAGCQQILNPAQREAAVHGAPDADGLFAAGPLLIIAGAGTGKTTTLAHRVAHLVVQGVRPERILLLTFTRRAAQEMIRRVTAIVRRATTQRQSGNAEMLPWAGTFHSIANRLLRRYAINVGLDPAFSVLDRGDSADLMDVVRHEHGLTRKSQRFPKKDTCLAIYSRCVNTRASLGDVLEGVFPWCGDWEAELRALFRAYVERKLSNQALDYDDLLLYWTHLVGDPELAREIGGWFDHVLVDEYQDTNLLQAEILHALKPDGRGLTVVGDDAQSIYAFRAAEVGNILGFAGRFSPPARVVTLEENYRSTQPILDSANCLMADGQIADGRMKDGQRHYRKTLVSKTKGGGRPEYVTVEDADAEAAFVIETVLANREAGMQLRDQAVLMRGSHSGDRLEVELVRRNIPYVKYGGLKFLEAAHVKDMLGVLKWAENPRNQIAAFRVLKLLPGMGPSSASKCIDHLASGAHSFAALAAFRPPPAATEDWPAFCRLLQSLAALDPGAAAWQSQVGETRRWYRPHLERLYDSAETREADLEQLEQISGKYPTRERFLTELTLDPPAAAGDLAADPLLDEDYLVLSTVHSAKGQEWKSVFILNFCDGSFPSEFATGKPAMIEEERRLLYVAMTRARQSLALVAPLRFYVTQQRRDGDRHVYGARSRFMSERLAATMTARFFGSAGTQPPEVNPRTNRRIDVAGRLRAMW